MSVSVTILSCGIMYAHGLFGEVITSPVIEEKEQEITIVALKVRMDN